MAWSIFNWLKQSHCLFVIRVIFLNRFIDSDLFFLQENLLFPSNNGGVQQSGRNDVIHKVYFEIAIDALRRDLVIGVS